MSDFGGDKVVIGRKRHRCGYCWSPIVKGEAHHNYRGMYDGEWQNWRMHVECFDDYAENGYGEFTSGEAPTPERVVKQIEAAK